MKLSSGLRGERGGAEVSARLAFFIHMAPAFGSVLSQDGRPKHTPGLEAEAPRSVQVLRSAGR